MEGQSGAVPTAAVVNYLVTHSDVKDETVYQMTKAVYESLPDLAAAHAAAKDIKLESAARACRFRCIRGARALLRREGHEEAGS